MSPASRRPRDSGNNRNDTAWKSAAAQHDLEEEPEMTVLLTHQRAALEELEELRPDGGLLL
ncbi:hypothetical protein [Streptomyces sp. NPDC058475]|uniref:hypothetical protein n=1 Tax=Streptomyces sp. NPDC058475 TaxID=3346518 RepID=UPI0036662FD5